MSRSARDSRRQDIRFEQAVQWLFWPFAREPDRPACAADSIGAACPQQQSRTPTEETMKHLRLLAALAVAGLSCTAVARPFTDPRGERSDAIDQSAALEPRDPACQVRT